MTRAEERALEIFPVKKVPNYGLTCNAYSEKDANLNKRALFCMGYEQAEKDLGWINVKDRLPEKDTVVLTCWDVNGVPQGIGLRLYDGQWQDFDEDDDIEISDPDYWMSIPQFNK